MRLAVSRNLLYASRNCSQFGDFDFPEARFSQKMPPLVDFYGHLSLMCSCS